jgi:phosphoribosylformylglycinamidine synthase
VAVVGVIEKPEHITTQWFKDEGDAIILLGELVDATDPLQGLGGSACLQVIHGKKTGSPPRCNLDKEKDLHLALRALIYSGVIKSAHDCSDGGLAVALAESCISQLIARDTPRLVGAEIDLSAVKDVRLDALLFGETQSRIVISVAALNAGKVLAQAKILGVPATVIGKVGGSALQIKASEQSFTANLADLHDPWWNSIARAMK